MSYLSFVFAISHVGYGGDFGNRVHNCLENLYRLAGFSGLYAEVVIAERDGSGIDEYVQSPATLPTKIVTVPNSVYDTIPNPHDEKFFEYWFKNVGIRRAAGEFILSTNPDNLYSPELIQRLARYDLDAGCFYRVNRSDIDKDGNVLVTHYKTAPELHFNASGDFILMHRDAWKKINGHPELSYSLTVDGQTVHLASQFLTQAILPEPMYHQNHTRGSQSFYEPWDDLTPYAHKNAHDTWGFSELEFETRHL